jgi:CDP-6-deoxy-D-xylo-4-hexulose-3-dehydrase
MSRIAWPLMNENILRKDLDQIILYLQQDNPKLTNGPKVREFENAWSNWLGVKHSILVNSGASANDLTLLALKETRGLGEIILPPLTWVSDVSAVIRAGFTPKFVDIKMETLAMDPQLINKAITPSTRAVFVTHVLGLNGVSKSLLDILADKGIPLLEDVCESHGATIQGRKLGTLGLASNFSFYFGHHMTTIEGGMICTDDDEFADIARMMRSHGLVRESQDQSTKERFKSDFPDLNSEFIFSYAAHNMRPTEINGILGLSQLPRLDAIVDSRTRNFKLFLNGLDPLRFFVDFDVEGSSNFALMVILRDADPDLQRKLEEFLVENQIEFRRGLAGGGNQLRQPYLRKIMHFDPTEFPNVEHVHFFSFYVGNFPELNSEIIRWFTNSINNL